MTLITTRVLDLATLGTEEEDEGETVDRASWERTASKASLQIVDRLVEMVNTVQSGMSPKYNKYYIGLASGGVARNFVAFRPRKSIVLTEFKIPQEDELTAWLDETGLSTVSYNTRYGNYRVRVRQSDLDEHRDAFIKLITKARDAYQTR